MHTHTRHQYFSERWDQHWRPSKLKHISNTKFDPVNHSIFFLNTKHMLACEEWANRLNTGEIDYLVLDDLYMEYNICLASFYPNEPKWSSIGFCKPDRRCYTVHVVVEQPMRPSRFLDSQSALLANIDCSCRDHAQDGVDIVLHWARSNNSSRIISDHHKGIKRPIRLSKSSHLLFIGILSKLILSTDVVFESRSASLLPASADAYFFVGESFRNSFLFGLCQIFLCTSDNNCAGRQTVFRHLYC